MNPEELMALLMKQAEEARDEKLTSGIDVKTYDATNIAEVADIIKDAMAGSNVNIFQDKAQKDDVNYRHEDVYVTITGEGKGDNPDFCKVTNDDKKRAYANRRFHGRAQDGRNSFIFLNEYQDENMELGKGSVLTLRGIKVPVGGTLVTVNAKTSTATVTKFAKGGWYVFSPFGYLTSDQEFTKIANAVTVDTKAEAVVSSRR